MNTLFDLPPEPEEGRAPKPLRLSPRKRALLEWVRAHGTVSSDAVPLGMAAKDLRELELDGMLIGEGAQVRVYRVAGGAR
jgi:hypothetical protein